MATLDDAHQARKRAAHREDRRNERPNLVRGCLSGVTILIQRELGQGWARCNPGEEGKKTMHTAKRIVGGKK